MINEGIVTLPEPKEPDTRSFGEKLADTGSAIGHGIAARAKAAGHGVAAGYRAVEHGMAGAAHTMSEGLLELGLLQTGRNLTEADGGRLSGCWNR